MYRVPPVVRYLSSSPSSEDERSVPGAALCVPVLARGGRDMPSLCHYSQYFWSASAPPGRI